MRINKIVAFSLVIAMTIGLTGCDFLQSLFGGEDPDDSDPLYADNVVVIEDSVTASAVWNEGKVYYINGTVSVSSGMTLTLEAGTIVKFGPDGSLAIGDGATIKANGTATKPVIFTSARDVSAGGDSLLTDAVTAAAKGDWNYVWAQTGSNSNVFTYCTFRYAGKNGYAALYVDGASTVDHCIFNDNLCGLPYGIDEATLDARSAETGTSITNNLFYSNTWPLAIAETMGLDASNIFEFDHDSSASTASFKNTHQAVYIHANGNISNSIAWAETDVPFCVFDDIGVDNGGTLTIQSGVVLKFSGSGSGLSIYTGGALNRTGAILTSYRDDDALGDTNADGTASTASEADWEGLWIDSLDGYQPDDAYLKYSYY